MLAKKIDIHKFGGSSLANAKCYANLVELFKVHRQALVLSAAAKTTTSLQKAILLASQKKDFSKVIVELKSFQLKTAKDLLNATKFKSYAKKLNNDFEKLGELLNAMYLVGHGSKNMSDLILAHGELWSANLLATYLSGKYKVICLDARQVLFVEHKQGSKQINWKKSKRALNQFLKNKDFQLLIITGFIARDEQGLTTTLGKNGSDYSAAIFAKLLNAKSLTKWTDVDGVYSADPRKVHSAFAIEELSYAEALELAYFGASIMHPQAMFPAIEKKIPVYIKNSKNPKAVGTLISQKKAKTNYLIQGITSIDDVALITIEGSGLIGVSGTAARVFQAMMHEKISVILISQASSEHSICFAVSLDDADPAIKVLKELFNHEIKDKHIEKISADKKVSILAVVGDNMVGSPGIAGRLCDTLAKANVNIHAISQGSSERNISIVVKRKEINRALRAVHGGFYLSNKTISIGIIGPGGVGGILLTQINGMQEKLKHDYGVNLRVRGIMNSKKMLLKENEINLKTWKQQFKQSTTKSKLSGFIEHIAAEDIPHAAIIDCTASDQVAAEYITFIDKGLHIITPNKKANSGSLNFYKQLQQKTKFHNRHFLYETTVCAGLPIIKTLQDLIQTGDEVISIEGVVSGTLGFIFYELAQGKSFSQAVLSAYEKGYTEPDPRDDLTGTDVARKFTCLARELGYDALLKDVDVYSLVPKELQKVDKKQFLKKLSSHDDAMNNVMQAKLKANTKLAYVGQINRQGKIKVSMQAYDSSHPFYHLKGTDNLLIFKTKRYNEFPLVIQGPGAGTQVTAAGVFADLLRLVSLV